MLENITDSIKQYPDSSRFYFERGGLLYVMKKYELAGKDIEKAIAIDPGKAVYYLAMGEIHLTENRLDAAENDYRKALQLDPVSLQPRLQLAYILLQQKKYRQALQETETLLGRDSALAEAYGLQSQAYQALGDTAKALGVMKKAVSLEPENYEALMAFGDLLLSRNDKAALQYYQRAQKADTASGEPLYCIGLFYEKNGQTGKAIAAYNKCIARDAYYLQAYLNSGKLYEKEKKWEKAREVFNLAVKISPVSSDAFYHRGLCNEKMDKPQAAIDDYNQALVLNSSNEVARTALSRLEKQRKLK